MTINHRKPWTIQEETRFAYFMIEQFKLGKKVKEALITANAEFNRKNCEDRWRRYGLVNLYAKEIKEARKIGYKEK